MADKPSSTDGKNLHCSFCNKHQNEVKKLISGPGNIFICDECIELCNEIIHDSAQDEAREAIKTELPSPAEIKSFLDQYVIGQDQPSAIWQ